MECYDLGKQLEQQKNWFEIEPGKSVPFLMYAVSILVQFRWKFYLWCLEENETWWDGSAGRGGEGGRDGVRDVSVGRPLGLVDSRRDRLSKNERVSSLT